MAEPKLERGRLVRLLYAYESETRDGKRVNVQPGERYTLIDDRDSLWIFVSKAARPTDEDSDGFYLPRNYVEPAPDSPPSLRSASLRERNGHAKIPVFSNGGTLPDRRKTYLGSEGDGGPASQAQNQRRSLVGRGFLIGDPKLAKKSIPAGLDVGYNISDLAAAQDLKERLNGGEPDPDSPHRPAQARPVSQALLPPGFLPRGSTEEPPSVDELGPSEEEEGSSSPSPSPPPPPPLPATTEHIYANQAELNQSREEERQYQNLEEYRNREQPPTPAQNQSPLRLCDEGWAEYQDEVLRHFVFSSPFPFPSLSQKSLSAIQGD